MGGKYKGRNLGTIGDAGVYSLDIGKIITAGEGGLLVTDNKGFNKVYDITECQDY